MYEFSSAARDARFPPSLLFNVSKLTRGADHLSPPICPLPLFFCSKRGTSSKSTYVPKYRDIFNYIIINALITPSEHVSVISVNYGATVPRRGTDKGADATPESSHTTQHTR